MSDSVQPHRWPPTRLPQPWESPGKNNTGVGCHFFLQCMKVKSGSEVAQSCPTLRDPMDCCPLGSSIHGILQARVLEWGAIAFSRISSYPSSSPALPPTSPNKTLSGGQTHFGNEASPEAQGVNSCREGCVLWGQHLRRREGAVGREGRSLRPDGSEEGRWGEVVRTQEMRKPRERGQKTEYVEKMRMEKE